MDRVDFGNVLLDDLLKAGYNMSGGGTRVGTGEMSVPSYLNVEEVYGDSACSLGMLSALLSAISFSDPEDMARHERMVELVERMLALHERLAEARIERERTVIGHQISAIDRQIDRLVYELYGLTEEMRIVEEATADKVTGDLSVERLEGFELAPYFERRVVNDPERRSKILPYVAATVNDPGETMTQPDGKVRY